MTLPARALPLLALAALLLPACLVSSDTSVEHRGQYVGPETLDKIEAGRNEAYVRALLGEPTERTVLEDGVELWRWTYSQVKRSQTGVIFVLGSKSSTEQQGAVHVEFKDGVVVDAWRD
jgi:outer membrane protein assembly factor BamE (lipoprotein component of BamABCDE complex)